MIWLAVGYAVFIWWFSTGAILMAVSRPGAGREDYLRRVIIAVPVLMLGCVGVFDSLSDDTVKGAFVGFTSALLIWGWFEMAFLAGIITGPNQRRAPRGARGFDRFLEAWGTIAYSETALILTAMLIVLLSIDAANAVAMWTYLVLFFARIFAKLNVYLGVPNINDDFLPAPVQHLTTHFRKAPMNTFFPFSVTALTLLAVLWAGLAAATTGGEAVAFTLLATLTVLALVEHWVMVLPLPDAALWRWMLPADTGRLK